MAIQIVKNKSFSLLAGLLLLISFMPIFESIAHGDVFFVIAVTAILFSGVYAVSIDKKHLIAGMALAVPVIITQWADLFLGGKKIIEIETVCLALFLGYTLLSLLNAVLTAKRVTINEIYSAISAYIMIGLIFGTVYELTETLRPGSLYFSHREFQHELSLFVYFSFSVLTTAGFGDITAVSPTALTLVTLQIIIGVTYTAALIGRLISASSIPFHASSDPS